jgi:hypothetical protein
MLVEMLQASSHAYGKRWKRRATQNPDQGKTSKMERIETWVLAKSCQ